MTKLQILLDEFKSAGSCSIKPALAFTREFLKKKAEWEEYDDEDDLSQGTKKDALELAQEILKYPIINGDENDYHNYAVALASADYPSLACDILERGLDRYSTDTDLLSDFLLYALRCNKEEYDKKCKEIYDRLKVLTRWSWRAYDFSIEYLLDSLNRGQRDEKAVKTECLQLVRKYQAKVRPEELDLAYITEAKIYSAFYDFKNERAKLEKAFKRTDIHLIRVGLRLARIYLKSKEETNAAECMDRVIRDINDIGAPVSPVYAKLLSLITRIAILMRNWKVSVNSQEQPAFDMSLVKEIVCDWDNVVQGNRDDDEETESLYEHVQRLVVFIKTSSGYQSEDDEE